MNPDDLEVLDNLLADLAQYPAGQHDLLREHLETARAYMVGAMPDEFHLNLHLAEERLNCLQDPELRTRIEDFVHGQLHPVNAR